MAGKPDFLIGTSGYSFDDWVGTFYPAGTQKRDMFGLYTQEFAVAELNFTYYRMPVPRTLEALARKSNAAFRFWVKANRATTHEQQRDTAGPFLEGIGPLINTGKLAGVLLQFPQSFHRTVDTRKFLAATLEDFATVPLAVEFRHGSWQHPNTDRDLRDRGITLVVPDVPDLKGLFHHAAAATTATGYLRLHSRDAPKWYAKDADRYDYHYRDAELQELAEQWSNLPTPVDQVYAFFNNCHGGQAADNAQAFARIVAEL